MYKDILQYLKKRISALKDETRSENEKQAIKTGLQKTVIALFRFVIIVGISYLILAPIIGILVSSFFSNADAYNPMVYLFAKEPTLDRYRLVIERMDYLPTILKTLFYSLSLTGIQILVCSMVGYGFARFDFPLKKILFACVVVMIVIPMHTIMLPLYMTFKNFDPMGLMSLFQGEPISLMGTPMPMYLMSIFGCGLRSGLFIYIFNQFFRGLPKEIEEAAFMDGAGPWYTYFRIMLRSATPSVITVAVFSMVWQYNDTFYAKLFLIDPDMVISKKIATLPANIANVDKILDVQIQNLYLDAGIVLIMVPIIIIYVVLQKYFIEGVERSGIVG